MCPIAGLPVIKVTPEGLIFVGQWVLVALACYWLLSLALRLVASTLRRAVWLLKLGGALACFGLILSDHRVGTETMAARLAVLVCVCVLLGVGGGGGGGGPAPGRRPTKRPAWRSSSDPDKS
ncbi:unnamed protein product [Menidia menidia]|uniref:(Atlantic silverside) hypothetical protein n=1 Tax=Menidia menidia TaxID=238744 RepID=A0A8S4BJ66_9TELE|nr:unnamed protein product [Menidia menidia]